MINNVIHIIRFTPKRYDVPYLLTSDYLITEEEDFVITEDNKKIRL